jgi:hypothetical protein
MSNNDSPDSLKVRITANNYHSFIAAYSQSGKLAQPVLEGGLLNNNIEYIECVNVRELLIKGQKCKRDGSLRVSLKNYRVEPIATMGRRLEDYDSIEPVLKAVIQSVKEQSEFAADPAYPEKYQDTLEEKLKVELIAILNPSTQKPKIAEYAKLVASKNEISKVCSVFTANNYSTRFIPPLSGFSIAMQELTLADIYPILPDAELHAFALSWGRACMGGNSAQLNGQRFSCNYRNASVVIGTDSGQGKSFFMDHATQAMHLCGYQTSQLDFSGSEFGAAAYARSDISWIDDINPDSQSNFYKLPKLKSLISGGSIYAVNKFEKGGEVTSKMVLMVNANSYNPQDISNMDSGLRSRINFLDCLKNNQLAHRGRKNIKATWEDLCVTHNTNHTTISALWIRKCFDYFCETVGVKFEADGTWTQSEDRLEAVMLNLRSQFRIKVEVNYLADLVRGVVRVCVLACFVRESTIKDGEFTYGVWKDERFLPSDTVIIAIPKNISIRTVTQALLTIETMSRNGTGRKFLDECIMPSGTLNFDCLIRLRADYESIKSVKGQNLYQENAKVYSHLMSSDGHNYPRHPQPLQQQWIDNMFDGDAIIAETYELLKSKDWLESYAPDFYGAVSNNKYKKGTVEDSLYTLYQSLINDNRTNSWLEYPPNNKLKKVKLEYFKP